MESIIFASQTREFLSSPIDAISTIAREYWNLEEGVQIQCTQNSGAGVRKVATLFSNFVLYVVTLPR
jgi:hypothetical protein